MYGGIDMFWRKKRKSNTNICESLIYIRRHVAYKAKDCYEFVTKDGIIIKLDYYTKYPDIHICEVHFNDILVIPEFKIFNNVDDIRWCSWVEEAGKKENYNEVLVELKHFVDDLVEQDRCKKVEEIKEKIRKIGR